MAMITEEFISKALKEFMGLFSTLKDAISFGERQKSVVGARLNMAAQEGNRKSASAVEAGTAQIAELAEQNLGLRVEKQESSRPTPGVKAGG